MEELSQNQKDNITLYAVYTILYSNTIACDSICELEQFVKDKDKETKKIYGALTKRIRHYKSAIKKITDGGYGFYTFYNSFMDDVNNEDLEEFKASVIQLYYDKGIEEYEFLGSLETARTMLYFSHNTRKTIIQKLKELMIPVGNLGSYSLEELNPIIENFSDWCYRKAVKNLDKGIVLMEDEDIKQYFIKINENILNYDSFEKSYEGTVKAFLDGNDRMD